jgi:hypothetical protein
MGFLRRGRREPSLSDFLVFQFDLEAASASASESTAAIEDAYESQLVGNFRCIAGSEVLFDDSAFPLGRFAIELRAWLDRVHDQPEPFVFREGGSVLPPVIRIFPGSEGWHVATLQREFASTSAFTLEQVLAAAATFLAALDAAALERD